MQIVKRVFVSILTILSSWPHSATINPKHSNKRYLVDMPIAVRVGTVKTPEFIPERTQYYWVLLQVDKTIPFDKITCFTATEGGNGHCGKEILVNFRWTIWDGEEIAATGHDDHGDDAKFTEEHVTKFLGGAFRAVAGKTYVATVTFTKDGRALDGTNPRLLIVGVNEE